MKTRRIALYFVIAAMLLASLACGGGGGGGTSTPAPTKVSVNPAYFYGADGLCYREDGRIPLTEYGSIQAGSPADIAMNAPKPAGSCEHK